ncbi:MAG: gamma carbonic anhydrase family protein [Hyphomicrobiales bacterium]|nr:gamma carbonic anhydrase family protein [Hyphomicrobiales bacterium]
MHTFGLGVVLNDPAFVHPSAQAYGHVTLEEGSSLWPNSVIRAETQHVRIGRFSNIQDFVMIHIAFATPTVVGDYCSITHHCTLHGCTIGDNCLIGINTTVMDGCVIGDNCIVAGHTFLKENTVIPDNSIVMGTPGAVVKTRNNFVANRVNALAYYENARAYAAGNHRAWDGEEAARAFARMTAEAQAAFAATREG